MYSLLGKPACLVDSLTTALHVGYDLLHGSGAHGHPAVAGCHTSNPSTHPMAHHNTDSPFSEDGCVDGFNVPTATDARLELFAAMHINVPGAGTVHGNASGGTDLKRKPSSSLSRTGSLDIGSMSSGDNVMGGGADGGHIDASRYVVANGGGSGMAAAGSTSHTRKHGSKRFCVSSAPVMIPHPASSMARASSTDTSDTTVSAFYPHATDPASYQLAVTLPPPGTGTAAAGTGGHGNGNGTARQGKPPLPRRASSLSSSATTTTTAPALFKPTVKATIKSALYVASNAAVAAAAGAKADGWRRGSQDSCSELSCHECLYDEDEAMEDVGEEGSWASEDVTTDTHVNGMLLRKSGSFTSAFTAVRSDEDRRVDTYVGHYLEMLRDVLPTATPLRYASLDHELAVANRAIAAKGLPGGQAFVPVDPQDCLLPMALFMSLPPIAVTLGASYFQRLLASNPEMRAVAVAARWFKDGGPQAWPLEQLPDDSDSDGSEAGGFTPRGAARQPDHFSSPPNTNIKTPRVVTMRALPGGSVGERALLKVYATCIYLAGKVADRVGYRAQLSTMLAVLLARHVSPAEAIALEKVCLTGLNWRLGPVYDLEFGSK